MITGPDMLLWVLGVEAAEVIHVGYMPSHSREARKENCPGRRGVQGRNIHLHNEGGS